MPALLDVGAVGARHLPLGLEVGEQRDVDPQLLLEGLVGPGVVDADPDQLAPFASISGLTSW